MCKVPFGIELEIRDNNQGPSLAMQDMQLNSANGMDSKKLLSLGRVHPAQGQDPCRDCRDTSNHPACVQLSTARGSLLTTSW